jgi:hypothetical protein
MYDGTSSSSLRIRTLMGKITTYTATFDGAGIAPKNVVPLLRKV